MHGAASGEYSAAVDDLRGGLAEVADISTIVASTLDDMSAAIGALRAEIESLDLQSEAADWQFASTMGNEMTACASAAADATGLDAAAGVIKTAAVCANSIAQIAIAARLKDIQQEQSQLAIESALANFQRDFARSSSAIAAAGTQVETAVARIAGANTRIRNLQAAGRRALSRALLLDSDPGDSSIEGAAGRAFHVSTVMRRRLNTLALRYEAAHRNAVRLAFLAKIALEQRLGMNLDELTSPMTLLDEPPANWHMDVCSMSGIDYDRLRNATPSATGGRDSEDAALDVPEDYAGEFVGDYVRKLALVFESYNFDYPFQDGTDTAVLSLRDEVWGVRAMCSVDVPNLLVEAGQLDIAPTPDGSRWGWTTRTVRPTRHGRRKLRLLGIRRRRRQRVSRLARFAKGSTTRTRWRTLGLCRDPTAIGVQLRGIGSPSACRTRSITCRA